MHLKSCLATGLALFLGACAAPAPTSTSASTSADPSASSGAPTLIDVHYLFTKAVYDRVDIEFTRIDAEGHQTVEFRSGVRNVAASVLYLKPGVYYVSSVSDFTHTYNHKLGGTLTLFEVKSGQVNYPGGWWIKDADNPAGRVADRAALFAPVNIDFSEQRNPDIAGELQQKFPALSGQPIVYTRLEAAATAKRSSP